MKGKRVNYRKNKELSKSAKLRKKNINRKGQAKYLYPEYMRSKAWLARRIRFYDSYGRVCIICGRHDTVIHHKSYLHLGNERDNELVVLCTGHHRDYHRLHGVKGNMIKETDAYIKEKREKILKAEEEKLTRKALKEEALGVMQANNP